MQYLLRIVSVCCLLTLCNLAQHTQFLPGCSWHLSNEDPMFLKLRSYMPCLMCYFLRNRCCNIHQQRKIQDLFEFENEFPWDRLPLKLFREHQKRSLFQKQQKADYFRLFLMRLLDMVKCHIPYIVNPLHVVQSGSVYLCNECLF